MKLLSSHSHSNGYNPLVKLQREMDRMFDRFGRQSDFQFGALEGFEPRMEIKDKGKFYVVKAEVPGMEEKDIKVSLSGNDTLIIEGERKIEQESGDEKYCESEFSYGSFYREIPLAEEVDEKTISAKYKHGMLMIHLDKLNPSKEKIKNIPISAS